MILAQTECCFDHRDVRQKLIDTLGQEGANEKMCDWAAKQWGLLGAPSGALTREIAARKENPKWIIGVGPEAGVHMAHVPLITLGPVSWRVEIKAAQGNVEEESLWLIDMALSLLRLSYSPNQVAPLFPGTGDSEADPTENWDPRDRGIIFSDDGLRIGGRKSPGIYTIGKALLAHHAEIDFATRAKHVFEAQPRTVGERVAQGLGWMTRGRRARDRSERFLFFFTAIEALLSSSDRGAPVVQTIARYAATILTPEAETRDGISKEIRQSYETRSALVHGGRRNVSHLEAMDAQILAEAVYISVLEKIALTTTTADFESDLAKASFGVPWPISHGPHDGASTS